MESPPCLYCPSTDFNDEHFLPACLGRFKGYSPLSGRICEGCNSKLGLLDEQMCRSSYAAFFRHYLGIKGRKKHRNKPSSFYRGSAGGGRIAFRGQSQQTGKTVELEYRDGQPMPLRHMLITTEDNSTHILPITEDMKEPQQLRRAFKKIVGKKRANAEIYCAPNEVDWIDQLVSGLKFEKRGPWTVENGPNTFNQSEINFVVTERFFRCIAKIGFQHFLERFPPLGGAYIVLKL